MKILRYSFLVLSIISGNIFAGEVQGEGSLSRMCVSAYLARPIHVGDVTFYDKNQPIGNISIYGAWLQTVTIDDGGYFKNQKDFEEKRPFLRVENVGERLDVKSFTYEAC